MNRSLILTLLTGLLLGGMLGCDLLGLGEEEPLGRIVFTKWDSTDTGRQRFVYTMNTDGSDLTRLSFPDERYPCNSPLPGEDNECGTGDAYSPRWSPDGEHITYVESAGPDEGHIMVMKADGSDKRAITPVGGHADKPRWSPNGKRLLYRQRAALGIVIGTFVMDADDGSGKTCISCIENAEGEVPPPITFQDDTLGAANAQWGATSDLLYTFGHSDPPERDIDSVYLFRLSTREVIRKVASVDLQAGLRIGSHGTIFPDGDAILFAEEGDIYCLSPPGAPAEKLTTGPNCAYGACGDFDVNWGNDGRHFVYARFRKRERGESRPHIRLGNVTDNGDGRRVSSVSGRYPDLFIPGE